MAITETELVSEEMYRRLAIGDPFKGVELHRGRLREKPAMTFSHNQLWFHLGIMLNRQLDRNEFVAGVNGGRVRRSAANFYIPDVFVTPTALTRPLRNRSDLLEVYEEPLPLVVEVWSPSTGDYDVNEKLAEYQRRGDLEIWRLHPYERTLTAWHRRPDGGYDETLHREGIVRPAALPGVAIDLGELFAVIG